ncbi:MAG TPA: ribosome maturation factor RimP [Alphaproteobacteria bacterium]|nr:ribosome maturation factor RimP [Alphaproteobacteria bacterium]
MEQTAQIERLIGPTVAGLGYELVRVQMTGGAKRPTLQVMAERRDRRAMLVDDCARLSREISAVLDAADPISDAYLLEVSSPGIDRPLVKPADYERFAGHEVRIEIDPPIDGRKRFHGTIRAIEDDAVKLAVEESEVRLPLSSIRRAKLVLTDRLIAEAMKESEEQGSPHAAEDAASLSV